MFLTIFAFFSEFCKGRHYDDTVRENNQSEYAIAAGHMAIDDRTGDGIGDGFPESSRSQGRMRFRQVVRGRALGTYHLLRVRIG